MAQVLCQTEYTEGCVRTIDYIIMRTMSIPNRTTEMPKVILIFITSIAGCTKLSQNVHKNVEDPFLLLYDTTWSKNASSTADINKKVVCPQLRAKVTYMHSFRKSSTEAAVLVCVPSRDGGSLLVPQNLRYYIHHYYSLNLHL